VISTHTALPSSKMLSSFCRSLNPLLRSDKHVVQRMISTETFVNPKHEFRSKRIYQGPVRAVVLDWAGTVLDCGVYSPAVVFIKVFEEYGVPISMDEARGPMGAHKKVHIRKITEIESVRDRWKKKMGKNPTEKDIEIMFEKFVPAQISVLKKYSRLIPGTLEAVSALRKQGCKIGSTTGFTMAMVDVLKAEASKQGYTPDVYVAADEVPQARPFPFMVWLNAIRLDVSPIEAIVKVDDTADGVREGTNAGVWSVGLAKTGNYVGLNEEEIAALSPEDYQRKLARSYEILANAGAHYVVDDITSVPRVVEDINRRLALGERP